MKTIVNKVRRPLDKEEEKKANNSLNDGLQNDWETGKLGRDVEHMKVSEMSLSGKPTSLRLPEDLRHKLTILARKKGLSTHSYIRMILLDHVDHNKQAS